ncbi:MAG: hypothetical protein F8N38_21220 [Hungatella sp.]|nr:hypothetical protein [Hungatella sp.]
MQSLEKDYKHYYFTRRGYDFYMTGNTDRPIKKKEEDVLGIRKYVEGLSEFIRICDTPMTIAIQGDWGSGKTSFMNMIQEEVCNNVVDIWFNTWQFSQFNLGDGLSTTLLVTLAERLDADDAAKQNIKKFAKFAGTVGNAVVTKFTDVDVLNVLKESFSSDNVIESITKLKENFQRCVNASLKKFNKEKLVIFVDDLDRLAPERAVEVLEVLKIFLDCENCVFVLAIDYDVVCRGIDKKYGEGFDKKKGKSFFDKIIQVPFKMPIANYEIEKYISASLKEMGFFNDNVESYTSMISRSIGYNPRGLKRIFNAFLLLKMIYKDMNFDTLQKQSMLFASLCLQMSYENIYNYIIVNENNDITENLMMSLIDVYNSGDSKVNEFYENIILLEPNTDEEELKNFMSAFCSAIKNEKNNITEKDMETLREILQISNTTSAVYSDRTIGNGKTGIGARYSNEYDPEYSYHSIEEQIEKTNAPAGWNGCKLVGYRLFGDEYKESNFASLVVNVLSELYKRDKEKFDDIIKNSENYKLYGLFYGSKTKNTLVAPKNIPEINIEIETKNSYDQKVKYLRNAFEAMGEKLSSLELKIRLAHRIV